MFFFMPTFLLADEVFPVLALFAIGVGKSSSVEEENTQIFGGGKFS
jgi:hypothetical protein